MIKRLILATIFLVSFASSSSAAYLDNASWQAALANNPYAYLEPFSTASITATDSFHTYPGVGTSVINPSSLQLTFSCHSAIFPCSGAFNFKIELPFDVIGIVGNLRIQNFFFGMPADATLFGSPFSLPSQSCLATVCVDGFYGDLFAPTNTLMVDWPGGHRSADLVIGFTLTDFFLVRVPEPTALAVFGVGLLALAGFRRRMDGSAKPVRAARAVSR